VLDIGYPELLLIAVVALVVIGPKDLPRVLRQVGQWIAKARNMARHVRSGFDTMVREAELEEMQKQWAAQNAAIMAAHPMPAETPGYTADPAPLTNATDLPPAAGDEPSRSDDGGELPRPAHP
jgi:sec-independent protein translocase protein TatB